MRVCLVAFANIMLTPYIKKYADICKANSISFDVIYWDRHGMSEDVDGCENLYAFEKIMPDSSPIYKKLVLMYRYSSFVEGILKKNLYDRVVVLTSLLGVFLEKYLSGRMAGKYIFDIRDYSYEHIKWYYNKMGSLMKNARLNVVSSAGFLNFLPEYDASVLHNCAYTSCGDEVFVKKETYPLKIAFIGLVRFEPECKKFLKCIANDSRVEFHFWGKGESEQSLKEFCRQEDINNVFFHGEYNPDQKNSICRDSDVIFNAYGNTLNLKYALSNKYYDAMYFKKPLLVNTDTSMEEFSRGMCFVVDYDKDVPGGLAQWYKDLEPAELEALAGKYLKQAIDENTATESKILEALK